MSKTLILIIGIFITFLSTALGSLCVYFIKGKLHPKVNSSILGFAAGVMIAAGVFGLIIPAIEDSASWGNWSFIPITVGVILGALLLVVMDKLVPHIHKSQMMEEGPKNHLSKAKKLFLAVTIHNIPEGLAVGIAFSSAMQIGTLSAYLSALSLAIGIAIQNFPEGIAIALPLQEETGSKNKAFVLGSLSAIVEPLFAVVGLLIANLLSSIMPWMLAFAAGAMIFVTIEDLIPDAKLSSDSHFGSWGFMLGFIVMMILEITLG